MENRTFTAEEACPRLDVFLSEKLGVTRSAAKKDLDGGLVTVGGKPAKASHPVAAHEIVQAEIPAPQALDLTPQDIPIGIVYEDEDIAVVDKPQGLTRARGQRQPYGHARHALFVPSQEPEHHQRGGAPGQSCTASTRTRRGFSS